MMAFLPTVFLTSITIVSYAAELGSSLSTIAPLLVNSTACGNSCLSAEERRNTLLQLRNKVIAELLGEPHELPQCGEGFWYRVAYLNMSNSSQVCPSNWVEHSTPVRTCERPPSFRGSCPGVQYSAKSLWYSKVCGRVIGYQDGSSDAFFPGRSSRSPDGIYVDGVSLIHGIPRNHIWTFAVGGTDGSIGDNRVNCPCVNQSASGNIFPPNFVGDNYFCESGNHGGHFGQRKFFEEDPVWDGQQYEGACCSNGKSPPWFSVTLPRPTSDDIEIRICSDEGTQYNEDSPVQMFEIYIQ